MTINELFQTILSIGWIVGAIFFLFGGNGILASFIALIPPIRRVARNDMAARKMLALTLGLIALVITLSLWTILAVEISIIFTNIHICIKSDNVPPGQLRADRNRSAFTRELWIRAMMPPPLRRPCYTTDPAICTMVDEALESNPFSSLITWQSWLQHAALSSISALIGFGLSWFFTRSKKKLAMAETTEQPNELNLNKENYS